MLYGLLRGLASLSTALLGMESLQPPYNPRNVRVPSAKSEESQFSAELTEQVEDPGVQCGSWKPVLFHAWGSATMLGVSLAVLACSLFTVGPHFQRSPRHESTLRCGRGSGESIVPCLVKVLSLQRLAEL